MPWVPVDGVMAFAFECQGLAKPAGWRRVVLMRPGSAYPAPKVAVALLMDHAGEAAPERLDALLQLLRHPPEGDGDGVLGDVMEMVATLDPDGAALIPVLIEAAEDKTHLSRQRGNPRGKAIELLGRFGGKASAAVPVIEAILASEADKSQHAAAQTALEAITSGRPQTTDRRLQTEDRDASGELLLWNPPRPSGTPPRRGPFRVAQSAT